MKVTAVIPARYGSTRLTGKPLIRVAGKPVIQYVVENVKRSRRVERVIVATDDRRIVEAVEAFGGLAVMTSQECESGTDRVAEVARRELSGFDVVVNVQGDEPELKTEQVDEVLQLLEADQRAVMATLSVEMSDPEVFADPNQVKVVTDRDGNALYFSRSPIPYLRDGGSPRFLKHLGIYAYRREFLLRLSGLRPTDLERAEKLEQLRALEHGFRIKVGRTDFFPQGIDTQADLERFRRKMEG